MQEKREQKGCQGRREREREREREGKGDAPGEVGVTIATWLRPQELETILQSLQGDNCVLISGG